MSRMGAGAWAGTWAGLGWGLDGLGGVGGAALFSTRAIRYRSMRQRFCFRRGDTGPRCGPVAASEPRSRQPAAFRASSGRLALTPWASGFRGFQAKPKTCGRGGFGRRGVEGYEARWRLETPDGKPKQVAMALPRCAPVLVFGCRLAWGGGGGGGMLLRNHVVKTLPVCSPRPCSFSRHPAMTRDADRSRNERGATCLNICSAAAKARACGLSGRRCCMRVRRAFAARACADGGRKLVDRVVVGPEPDDVAVDARVYAPQAQLCPSRCGAEPPCGCWPRRLRSNRARRPSW